MNACNLEVRAGQGRLPRTNQRNCSTALRGLGLVLLLAVAVFAMSATASAQAILGSPGATWQTWNLDQDSNNNFIDLNSNGYPYWDYPLLTFNNGGSVGYGGYPANKSIGWCMTSTGDCQGIGSALTAPGPLPFWGMTYNAGTDSGGGIDPRMYFRSSPGVTYQATLYLNTATNNREINEFGWFETNSSGTVNGTKHVLFQGSGYPPGTLTPDPVGKVVNFIPTRYYGFYYQDVSDPEQLNGPEHGCYASTIFAFNDEDCTQAGAPGNIPGQGDHVFAIFLQQVPNRAPIYWVAGQDPTLCSEDGDCNLTVVKVRRLPLTD